MAGLSIKERSKDLHRKLKARAAANRRTLNRPLTPARPPDTMLNSLLRRPELEVTLVTSDRQIRAACPDLAVSPEQFA